MVRPRHARRVREALATLPPATHPSGADESGRRFPPGNPGLGAYYRMRLRLLLRGIRLHGRAIEPDSVIISGEKNYRSALASGRPVALLGLHAGVLELLHRLPNAPQDRPFLILTAPAFAPALSAYMARGRERNGKSVLWNRPLNTLSRPRAYGGRSFTVGLRDAVKSKGVLALMADQHPGPEEDAQYLHLWDRLRVPYPARLLDFLAAKGFLFLPVSTLLRPDGKSDFNFHAAWDAADLRSNLQAFLEERISAAPDQWNWSYPKVSAMVPRACL
jgi:lauroyl/myristoyl acyltransferase